MYRTTTLNLEEKHNIILECRQSGLADLQWCEEHDIKPADFYYWLKRLHRAGMDFDIPNTKHLCNCEDYPTKQDVVKISFDKPVNVIEASNEFIKSSAAIEVIYHDACVRIPDGISTSLVAQTFKVLKECL